MVRGLSVRFASCCTTEPCTTIRDPPFELSASLTRCPLSHLVLLQNLEVATSLLQHLCTDGAELPCVGWAYRTVCWSARRWLRVSAVVMETLEFCARELERGESQNRFPGHQLLRLALRVQQVSEPTESDLSTRTAARRLAFATMAVEWMLNCTRPSPEGRYRTLEDPYMRTARGLHRGFNAQFARVEENDWTEIQTLVSSHLPPGERVIPPMPGTTFRRYVRNALEAENVSTRLHKFFSDHNQNYVYKAITVQMSILRRQKRLAYLKGDVAAIATIDASLNAKYEVTATCAVLVLSQNAHKRPFVDRPLFPCPTPCLYSQELQRAKEVYYVYRAFNTQLKGFIHLLHTYMVESGAHTKAARVDAKSGIIYVPFRSVSDVLYIVGDDGSPAWLPRQPEVASTDSDAKFRVRINMMACATRRIKCVLLLKSCGPADTHRMICTPSLLVALTHSCACALCARWALVCVFSLNASIGRTATCSWSRSCRPSPSCSAARR